MPQPTTTLRNNAVRRGRGRGLLAALLLTLTLALTACNPFAPKPPPPMPDLSHLPEVVMPSGLKYIEIQEGTGPAPRFGGRAIVHYTGWLPDGTQVDTSRADDTALEFAIGKNDVIEGWEQGVLTMKVGGQRRLIIPPELGYGDQKKGSIPPNSTLIFDIELIGLK